MTRRTEPHCATFTYLLSASQKSTCIPFRGSSPLRCSLRTPACLATQYLSMRYGTPSPATALAEVETWKCRCGPRNSDSASNRVIALAATKAGDACADPHALQSDSHPHGTEFKLSAAQNERQRELHEPGRSARWRTIRNVAAVAQWQSSRLVSGRSSVRSRPAAPTWQKLCDLRPFCLGRRG